MAQKQYRCKICDARFDSELEWERHTHAIHAHFRCEVCGHTFKSESELRTDSWIAHPDDAPVREHDHNLPHLSR